MENVALVVTGITELAKLALQLYFMSMQLAGKTQEEIDAYYKEQGEYFVKHPAVTLPDKE